MLRLQSFSILCAITLLVIIAAVVTHEDTDAIPGAGEPVFPDLLSAVNQVQSIRVTSGGKTFSLKQVGGDWVAPDRFDHPADADKVHSLLVGAAGMTRVEPKTGKSELYPKLGLGDPANETSPAVAFVLEGDGGETIASWITGNTGPAKADPEASEIYVRIPDDPQAWLVEGKLPRDVKLVDWLDRSISSVDRKRVHQVRVRHRDGEEVVVRKEAYEETDFLLSDMPGDMDVNGQWRINDIGRAFSNLELEDVSPRSSLPEDASPRLEAIMQTFDGLEVILSLYQVGEQSVAVLAARFDQGLRVDSQAKIDVDTVRGEADGLNAKWRRWVYTLPDFKADHLAQKRDTLLKSKSGEGGGGSG
ncbi:MAG: DUF4340 domain-containing protein [Gammaproteobacteria bacterium]|nr:DUF4340 domain-containing protein [Gammaproteobacteria bacterium]